MASVFSAVLVEGNIQSYMSSDPRYSLYSLCPYMLVQPTNLQWFFYKKKNPGSLQVVSCRNQFDFQIASTIGSTLNSPDIRGCKVAKVKRSASGRRCLCDLSPYVDNHSSPDPERHFRHSQGMNLTSLEIQC